MLIQLIFQIAILCSVAVVGCLACLSTVVIKNCGIGIPAYLCAYISENLPLNSLLVVVLQVVFAVFCCTVFFRHISNHIVISMDILYLESLLLFFFCYTVKAYRNPLTESME